MVDAACGVDELDRNPNAIARATNAALQHVPHPELATDLANIDRLTFVLKGRVASDDKEPRKPRQLSDNVLGESVTEVVLLWVAAEIGEREHGEGRPVREGQNLDCCCSLSCLGGVNARCAAYRDRHVH